MDYKLCILAAGKGTRNKYVETNKALLPLGEGTALSYIIKKFPPEIEIVIAVGYNAQQVALYALKKWRKRVTCVKVDYEGEGYGPGYSLSRCAPLLQCPFIYTACDTIVTDNIPEPKRNWIGISLTKNNTSYTTVRMGWTGRVEQVYNKGDKQATPYTYNGLVAVNNYKDFWEGLANPTIVQGEYQDTSGIRALIPLGLYPRYFHWMDTGTTEGYENAKRHFDKAVSS